MSGFVYARLLGDMSMQFVCKAFMHRIVATQYHLLNVFRFQVSKLPVKTWRILVPRWDHAQRTSHAPADTLRTCIQQRHWFMRKSFLSSPTTKNMRPSHLKLEKRVGKTLLLSMKWHGMQGCRSMLSSRAMVLAGCCKHLIFPFFMHQTCLIEVVLIQAIFYIGSVGELVTFNFWACFYVYRWQGIQYNLTNNCHAIR